MGREMAVGTLKKIKQDIINRFSGAVMFTAEIECAPDALPSIKLGLAVQVAVKAGANLAGAYLAGANLAGANLAGAYLAGAYLAGANLAGAYLAGANLAGAYLAEAYLADVKNADFAIAQTRILPDGDLIGWKKCMQGVIVKLRIPEAAKRSHAFGRKCRAEYADVVEVIGADVGISKHDCSTEYRVGQRVIPDRFDENWAEECSSGIHFFITRLEAEVY
jgi:hypothetical protein